MKTIRNILALLLVLLVLALLALPAAAQQTLTVVALSTNRVVANATNTTDGTAFYIGSRPSVELGYYCRGTNDAAYGTGDASATVTVVFKGSPDGTTYFNDGTNLNVVITPGRTNAQYGVTTLTTTRWQWLQPDEIRSTFTNANSVHWLTNLYWWK